MHNIFFEYIMWQGTYRFHISSEDTYDLGVVLQ